MKTAIVCWTRLVKASLIAGLFLYSSLRVDSQSNLVNFNSIPSRGTILIYSHLDDDLIWMLPFWKITEKFIGGAMPTTPSYNTVIQQQQIFLDANGYGIDYESNWYTPWDPISDREYNGYYLADNPDYSYLVLDHLESRRYDNNTEMSRYEINKIKAKLEHYFADSEMSRVVTHNNWGEYGHQHHRAVNKAVRELAVKYRKDVWMLGCDNGSFRDVNVPSSIKYTIAGFNDTYLYTGIRDIYENNGRWTWYTDRVPSGDHRFIMIVEGGVDRSNILTGESVTSSGPRQDIPRSYIFDGSDDYMTIRGNNHRSFTIAMRVRPDLIGEMSVAKMAEYPLSERNDRNININQDGSVTARIYDGSSRTVSSLTRLIAGQWTHIAITSNGTYLRLYVNGHLQNSINSGSAITNYSTPELVLGQATGSAGYFRGQINDVRMYDHVLSDNEIAALSGDLNTIIISSSAGSGGTITPSGNISVDYGSSRSFEITPNQGYNIADVRIDNVSAGRVTEHTFRNITTGHSIYATFSPVTYTLTCSAGIGGTIGPSGEIVINYGSSRTISIEPSEGYLINDVIVDNASIGPVATYTFSNIRSDHSISAVFEPIKFTISSSDGVGGFIDPSGDIVVNYNTNASFRINPDLGYHISDVKVDGISEGKFSEFTFNNVRADHIISAEFAINTYKITADCTSGGSISPSGEQMVNYGADLSFVFSADAGYQLDDVIVDGQSVGKTSEYIFHCVSGDHVLNVVFKKVYKITAESWIGGSIDPEGMILVPESSSYDFTISPEPGYRIQEVFVDGLSVGETGFYTFEEVISDHSIKAFFTNSIIVKAFPNPFGELLNLEIKSPGELKFDLYIENLANKTVFRLTEIPGNSITHIMPDFSSGLYILKLNTNGKPVSTLKVLKHK